MSVAKPDYSASPDAPYSAVDVVISAKMGHSLSGTLMRPKGTTGRLPAMVTITGSGLQDRDEAIPLSHRQVMMEQAEALANAMHAGGNRRVSVHVSQRKITFSCMILMAFLRLHCASQVESCEATCSQQWSSESSHE